jgi:hypothetical protein
MSNGQHQRLDYKDMSYWAKQNVFFSQFYSCLVICRTDKTSFQVLHNSDMHNPPNAITLDRRPKRSRPNSFKSASGPEIHVHLEGLGDALRAGGSVLSNCALGGNPIKSASTGLPKQGTNMYFSHVISSQAALQYRPLSLLQQIYPRLSSLYIAIRDSCQLGVFHPINSPKFSMH